MVLKSSLTEDEEEYIFLVLQASQSQLLDDYEAAEKREQDAKKAFEELTRQRMYIQKKLEVIGKFLKDNE